MLRERDAALTLIDYPRMEAATAEFVYVRWLGDRREDLEWWSERFDRFLGEGREVFAYANNHHQNRSPSTLAQLREIRRR